MPNRIIREGILTSDRVDTLEPQAELFYRRLLNKVDDHGLYDARPSILRANLFPLRLDRVREADCSRWLAACQTAGLIALYETAGKPYLMALNTNWQVRSEAKYPKPTDKQLKAAVISCSQLSTLVVDVVEDVVVEENAARATDPPPVDNPGTRRGKVAALLRAAGVKVTSQHPQLVEWVGELNATDEQFAEAIERARLNKPKPQPIPAAYLDPIIREVCAGVRANKVNGHGAWWSSEATANAKGKDVGVTARPGESTEQFHGRIRAALAERERAAQ